MEIIEKYLDNPLFVKWVYESDQHIEEYWRNYLQKNPNEKKIVISLKKELQLFQIRDYKLSDRQKSQLSRKIYNQISADKRTKTFSLYYKAVRKYAAVVVLTIAVTTLFYYLTEKIAPNGIDTQIYTTAIADNGQISKIILPDSTVVWLNSGSNIKYATDYASQTREVFLDGQAFFDVTKNRKIPFNVYCKDMVVSVLGTRFDVNAYASNKDIEVVLETGKVRLLKPSVNNFSYDLSPGEKAIYKTESERLYISKVKLDKYVMWKKGVIIFEEDRFSEVIPILQRKYNVDLQMNIADLDNYLFTATITDETLDEIMKSIAFTCNAKYEIISKSNNKKLVVITK